MAYRPTSRIWAPSALTVSAVTTADLKDYVRVTHSLEDTLIGALGLAATSAVERESQRLLQVRAVTLRLQAMPDVDEPIELPGGPVVSITSVTVDGNAVTGCVAFGDAPAVMFPASSWPVATGIGYPVTITYQAGHATVPQTLSHAVKMTVAHWYENRAAVDEMTLTEVPMAVKYLIGLNRIRPI